jgi:hypothetical protein
MIKNDSMILLVLSAFLAITQAVPQPVGTPPQRGPRPFQGDQQGGPRPLQNPPQEGVPRPLKGPPPQGGPRPLQGPPLQVGPRRFLIDSQFKVLSNFQTSTIRKLA